MVMNCCAFKPTNKGHKNKKALKNMGILMYVFRKGIDMKKITFFLYLLLSAVMGGFITLGWHYYSSECWMRVTLEERQKGEQRYKTFFQNSIIISRENGVLAAIDPAFSSLSPEFRTKELLKLLQNTDRIKEFFFEGRISEYGFDGEVMDFIQSMPDLEELYIYRSRLHGNLFEPLKKSPKLKLLMLKHCNFDMYAMNSLTSLQNIEVLVIAFPYINIPERENYRENIVESLCQLKSLQLLVLDDSFITWDEKLRQELPNTTTFIYSPTSKSIDRFSEIPDNFSKWRKKLTHNL
jgi:hypothetical protein